MSLVQQLNALQVVVVQSRVAFIIPSSEDALARLHLDE
jgi:hypothetical protein